MDFIMIRCLKTDDELIEQATNSFNDVDVIEEDGFSGEDFAMIAIPIAQLTLEVIDFICTHMTNSKKGKENNSNNVQEKRVLVSPEGELSLTGYSQAEVVKILKELGFHYDD